MIPASIVRHFFAFLIDSIIIFFFSALTVWLLTRISILPTIWLPLVVFLLVFYPIYESICLFLFHTTVGGKFFAIKIIPVSGTKLSLVTILMREFLFKPFFCLPLGLGFSVGLFYKHQTTWYDSLLGLRVIRQQAHKRTKRKPSSKYVNTCIFLFLFLFSLFAELGLAFMFYFSLVYTLSPPIPCYFQKGNLITKSNHFTIYAEPGDFSIDPKFFKLIFEQAFDYSFWLISPLSTTTSQTAVCLYTNKRNFAATYDDHHGTYPAYAFFSPLDYTIHFSADFMRANDESKRNAVYHEVNHFILTLFLDQNNYQRDTPAWFKEGLAQLVGNHYQFYSENSSISYIKTSIRYNRKPWKALSTYSVVGENFSAAYFYDESFLIIKYLEERYGTTLFPKIIQTAAKSNISIEQAIQDVTSEPIASLESEWVEWLQKE